MESILYVPDKKGEKIWEYYLTDPKLKLYQTSEEKLNSLREEFSLNQKKNLLNNFNKYLVNGVYLEFKHAKGEPILLVKSNTVEGLEKIAKEFNLPTNNKANLSEESQFISSTNS